MIQPQNEMCFCLSVTKQTEDPIHMSCQMKQKCKWIVQQLARKKEKQNKTNGRNEKPKLSHHQSNQSQISLKGKTSKSR